jgi:hypothetical protein
LAEVTNAIQFKNFREAWRKVITAENWNSSFIETANNLLEGKKAELEGQVAPDDDIFPGDLSNTYAHAKGG